MSCSCVCAEFARFSASITRARMRSARRSHECGECGRTIEPGERYESTFGVWDGRASTEKTCSDCLSVRGELFCEGWAYGELYQSLAEHIAEFCGDSVAGNLSGLTPRARELVCEMIEEEWE